MSFLGDLFYFHGNLIYKIRSSTTISDLQVIGKSTLPRKPDNFVKNDLNYSPSTTDGGASDESDADSADDEGIEEEVVVARGALPWLLIFFRCHGY